MSHENSQLDISDRQLMATNAQPRAGVWTEIGEAEITHTIFGRAKVRIIRKHDKTRHAWLLAAMVVVTALAAAAWQGWIASHQTEALQSADLPPPVSAKLQENAPTFQPENIAPPATPTILESKPGAPAQTEINKPAISQKNEPQQSAGLKGDEQMAAKPVKARPLKASKPQTAPLAADDNASMNQMDKALPPKLTPPIQPIAPAVAIPPPTRRVAQPAASSPVAVHPLAAPLVKEDTTTQLPAGNIQPTDPVNPQSK